MSAAKARHEAKVGPTVRIVPVGDLAQTARLLEAALDIGGHRLDPQVSRTARQALSRVDERSRLSGDHTVVALAGATGSGKSSLFNALTGVEIATVGARRPTTSAVTSCTWGPGDPSGLLDWLGVPTRHRVSHESALDDADGGGDELRGLVLLDLPDYDSTESAHQVEVDRILDLVDVFVWVTDPQKYADAALHRGYLSRLAGHDAVTVVLLNQADRLSEVDLQTCRRDLERLVEADGLHGVPVIATSVVSGAGVDPLREQVALAVHRRNAWSMRSEADLHAAAVALLPSVGSAESDPTQAARGSGLVDSLAGAAGVPAVVAAVEADYRRGVIRAAGWPVLRVAARLRPDPLRSLRLRPKDQPGTRSDGAVEVGTATTRLARTSLPAATPSQQAQVDLAIRAVGERAAQGLPDRWAGAVRGAAGPVRSDLADALDQAVLGVDLGLGTPRWWRVAGGVQGVLGLTLVVGLGWLATLAVLGWLRVPAPTTPYLGVLPVPTVLLLGGLVLGLLLHLMVRSLAGPASLRRAGRARDRLHRAVEDVAAECVVGPVSAVLRDHQRTREALAVVGGLPADR